MSLALLHLLRGSSICRYSPSVQIILSGKHPLLRGNLRVLDVHEPGVLVDASQLRFVSPLELVGIAALALDASHRREEAKLVVPRDIDVASYLQRMNLLEHAADGLEVVGSLPPDDRTDRSKVLLEVTKIQEAHEADALAERIVPLARGQSDARVTNAVFMGLGEFLDNACSHSGSPVGVFAAAQAYTGETSGRRGLELAVADAGVGILSHLRQNPTYADSDDRKRRSPTPSGRELVGRPIEGATGSPMFLRRFGRRGRDGWSCAPVTVSLG